MTTENKQAEIEDYLNRHQNEIYKAVLPFFEGLEHKEWIYGNGHHIAQEITQRAIDIAKLRIKTRLGIDLLQED
jgi:hypothetical protein